MSDDGKVKDLLPEGDAFRKAVRWISEERELRPGTKLYQLIDEASLRFDLDPKESAYLLQALQDPPQRT